MRGIMLGYTRVWAEIDTDAAAYNLNSIKEKINNNTKIIAVIKTDGYGHGAVILSQIYECDSRVWGYAVATADEADELARSGVKKPVLILGYAFPQNYESLIDEDIRLTVFTYEAACGISAAAGRLGKTCRIHIKVDTGMNRIGVKPDAEGIELVKKISQLPYLEIEGIFTHFARADEEDLSKARGQLDAFTGFVSEAERQSGISIPLKHCSNSAGIVQLPEANLDAVRAGIILYGLYPSNEVKAMDKISLKPVLSLKSRIVHVKTVPPGQEISYGGTFITSRATRIATVCIGYGDGYPRSLSNIGQALICGHRAPIIGRVCMDQLMLDVTDIKEDINVGDIVTLIGSDGGENITMEELGELSGRFNYELACDLGKRIARVVK